MMYVERITSGDSLLFGDNLVYDCYCCDGPDKTSVLDVANPKSVFNHVNQRLSLYPHPGVNLVYQSPPLLVGEARSNSHKSNLFN